MASGALTMGHARAILGIPGRENQLAARKVVLAKGLSVRETELLAKRLAKPRQGPMRQLDKKDIYINELETSLRNALGTKVAIRRGSAATNYYFSAEDSIARQPPALKKESP
jgi:ParB family chromosome partitioning protein